MDKFQYGVEVILPDQDAFLKIKETLTRIGIASKKDKTLYQSCHILHKKGLYYIVHFKELFALDGKQTDISETDIGRRNTITNLLQDWALLKIVDPGSIEEPTVSMFHIKIISFKDKGNWKLQTKYSIGQIYKNH